jgi:hypothetical protein
MKARKRIRKAYPGLKLGLIVEQFLLQHRPFAHHQPNLLSTRRLNQHFSAASPGLFQHGVMGGCSSAEAD